MALILDQVTDKLFGSWYSPALCLAVLTVVLVLILWVGGAASDWVSSAVKWTGGLAVVTALAGGWFASRKKVTDSLAELASNV